MADFTYNGNDLDNIFMTTSDLVDQYRGNRLWSWGLGTSGELGNASTKVNLSSPATTSGGGTTWELVSANGNFSAAIKTDGTLWTWGTNGLGQLGTGTVTARSSPGTTAGGGTSWKIVNLGGSTTGAVKTDGTLWTWGLNDFGQLGIGTTVNRSSPGTTAGGGTNWNSVSMSSQYSAGIKTDGTIWLWGFNSNGELGDGTKVSKSSPVTTAGGGTNWRSISISGNSSLAIKTDGTLWTWGNNANGQLGDGTITARSSPGTTAGGGTTWNYAASCSDLIAAIKTDGTLWTWGRNDFGQLGNGTTVNRSSPGTTAGGGTNWQKLGARSWGVAAIKTDGTLWNWGYNANGELGNGTTVNRSSPGTTLASGVNWKTVSTGSSHTLAIDTLG